MKKIKHNSFVVKTAPKDPFHISEETELRSLEPRTRVYPDLHRTARNLLAGGDFRGGWRGCRQKSDKGKDRLGFYARISLNVPVLSEKLWAGTPSDCRKVR